VGDCGRLIHFSDHAVLYALSPPATSYVALETMRAASEARKTTTGATSSGSIQRRQQSEGGAGEEEQRKEEGESKPPLAREPIWLRTR